jgi:hypothetical protein
VKLPPLSERRLVIYVSPDAGASWVRVTQSIGMRAAVLRIKECIKAGYDKYTCIKAEYCFTQKQWAEYYHSKSEAKQPDLFGLMEDD